MGAIQRKILVLEEQGADKFFGEPALDIWDLIRTSSDGRGIVNCPIFEVAEHLAAGDLVEVAPETPPVPAQLACLYPHRQYQDPKIRLFLDYMTARCRDELRLRTRQAGAGAT